MSEKTVVGWFWASRNMRGEPMGAIFHSEKQPTFTDSMTKQTMDLGKWAGLDAEEIREPISILLLKYPPPADQRQPERAPIAAPSVLSIGPSRMDREVALISDAINRKLAERNR